MADLNLESALDEIMKCWNLPNFQGRSEAYNILQRLCLSADGKPFGLEDIFTRFIQPFQETWEKREGNQFGLHPGMGVAVSKDNPPTDLTWKGAPYVICDIWGAIGFIFTVLHPRVSKATMFDQAKRLITAYAAICDVLCGSGRRPNTVQVTVTVRTNDAALSVGAEGGSDDIYEMAAGASVGARRGDGKQIARHFRNAALLEFFGSLFAVAELPGASKLGDCAEAWTLILRGNDPPKEVYGLAIKLTPFLKTDTSDAGAMYQAGAQAMCQTCVDVLTVAEGLWGLEWHDWAVELYGQPMCTPSIEAQNIRADAATRRLQAAPEIATAEDSGITMPKVLESVQLSSRRP